MTNELRRLAVFLVAAVLVAGCAAGRAYSDGMKSMKAGDFDQAVVYFRTAIQSSPDNPNYKIGLERAMQAASRDHFEKAKKFVKAAPTTSAGSPTSKAIT